jgi:hypothetical protein
LLQQHPRSKQHKGKGKKEKRGKKNREEEEEGDGDGEGDSEHELEQKIQSLVVSEENKIEVFCLPFLFYYFS